MAPNILFLITDQQRADHYGFMGNDVVATPHLDSIAARGTVFDNMWVANPVCMPNRSTIMTGRMPSAHGVIFNDRSLEWGANTFVRSLRSAGYRTALLGKSHLQHGMSRMSISEAPVGPAIVDPHPDGWDRMEHFERYLDEMPDNPDDFYGFDHVELAIDHGARVTGHHLRWALDRGGRIEDLVVPLTGESPARRRSDRWWQIYEPPYGPELHSTSFVTERTVSFIEEAAGQDKPWFAFASFPDPHHPMCPPGEWFDRYDPADMELPASIDDPLDHAPAHLRRVAALSASDQKIFVTPFGTGDRELIREMIASTYALIDMIDEGVGTILETVERLGQTDDTIVVVTSDHGDMMGDHGLVMKGFMPYRGTQQVALAIADPRRPAARTSSLAGSIDLPSTVLDLCGLDEYHGMQGHSLVPILDDPTAAVRDRVLVEDDLPELTAAKRNVPAKTRSLITDRYRYSRLSTGEEMLFDIQADPDELHDLSATDTALRTEAVETLMDTLIATDDAARGAPAV